MTPRLDDEVEDVLAAFAVEPDHGQETLNRYLINYPHLRSALLALVLELEFEEIDDSALELDSSSIAKSWERYSQRSPEPLISARFTREVATALGVKSAVLVQLRDRAISVASIPQRFFARLAKALGTSLEDLSTYLDTPRTLTPGVSYKSEGKPAVAQQMTLVEVMSHCGHTPEEIALLLGEE